MSGSPLSLWARIAPFDQHSHFLSRCLWPYLSDDDVMQAMMANSATMARLPHLTVRHAFKLSELPTSERSTRSRPRITAVVGAEPHTLLAAVSRLQHVTSLSLTICRLPTTADWSVPLPPSLTQLQLSLPGHVWERLKAVPLPSSLQELTIDDCITDDSPLETSDWLDGLLPPHVHTLSIRTSHWDWPTFQRLHLTADSTQLRSLCVTATSGLAQNVVDGSLLPRSLTLLDLSDCDYNQPLSVLHLPNLVTLKLGESRISHRGFSWPITADSFAGLPVLRELDLRNALAFGATLSVGALPLSLTSLSLPRNYRTRIDAGALPASLLRLRVAHACENHDWAPGANTLQKGSLPAGLQTFIIQRRRRYHPCELPLPFTHHLLMLPVSLVELRLFSHAFNQPLDALACLPHFTTLTIHSARFAQPLEPISHLARLHTLELYIDLPYPLPSLPSQLRHLTVRPASDMPKKNHRDSGSTAQRGYVHQLTAQQFAVCDGLESVSIDADVYDVYGELTGVTYVRNDWQEQQQYCPLFSAPIASDVLPASLQRLRLPQHYPHGMGALAVPVQCNVWKGRQRVR